MWERFVIAMQSSFVQVVKTHLKDQSCGLVIQVIESIAKSVPVIHRESPIR